MSNLFFVISHLNKNKTTQPPICKFIVYRQRADKQIEDRLTTDTKKSDKAQISFQLM